MKDMKYYEGKQVYIKLNSGRVYSGVIIEVEWLGKDAFAIDKWILTLRDKFNALVCFSPQEISLLEEEK